MPPTNVNAIVILRHNTKVGGDVQLAVREYEALLGKAGAPLRSRDDLRKYCASARAASVVELARTDTIGLYVTDVSIDRVVVLLQRSAFAQEVFLVGPSRDDLSCLAAQLPVPAHLTNDIDGSVVVGLSQSYVLESEGVLGGASERRLERTIELLLEPFLGAMTPSSCKLRKAKKTTLSLSHDLHIYKAKFFPRMVRALLNIFAPSDGALVVDPYCGSGTALLEGALLGYHCVGIDMDPICALISRAKVAPFLQARQVRQRLDAFREEIKKGHPSDRAFPSELEAKIRRRDKIDGTAYLPEITTQAAVVADAVTRVNGKSAASDLIKTIASDSVTKKVRFRFVGVGNGKYTIEIVKQALVERLLEKVARSEELCSVFPQIPVTFGCDVGTVEVALGDARDCKSWPINGSIDVVLTSPPYLPASSGREHYAASRALSFYVLGMRPGEHGYYDNATHAKGDFIALDSLPEAKRLMDYLASDASENADPQRDAMRFERKAIPTHGYLSDIRQFFNGVVQRLKPDGVLLLVVAHHHVFYSHRRGEVEHVVSCRELYSEIAAQAGLHLHEEIEMELVKSAVSHARPMAKDDYYESVLVFRRTPRQVM